MLNAKFEILIDRTGFPLISKEGWDYYISLFPVSKYQFERYMSEVSPKKEIYSDSWYRELLVINPRVSWKEWNNTPWRLFMTGVKPEETTSFLTYLGKDFRLPEVEEWKALLHSSDVFLKMRLELKELCENNSAPPVTHWIKMGLFPLTKEGILEIVKYGDEYKYIGRPWQEFWPNCWSPEEVREAHWELAQKMIGFRVVKEKKG